MPPSQEHLNRASAKARPLVVVPFQHRQTSHRCYLRTLAEVALQHPLTHFDLTLEYRAPFSVHQPIFSAPPERCKSSSKVTYHSNLREMRAKLLISFPLL